jgi:acyl-CoA hydrolase
LDKDLLKVEEVASEVASEVEEGDSNKEDTKMVVIKVASEDKKTKPSLKPKSAPNFQLENVH